METVPLFILIFCNEVAHSYPSRIVFQPPLPFSFTKKENVEETAQEIIKYYLNQSYPFVRVKIEDVFIKNDTIFYFLSVEKGEKVKIKDISFLGDFRTKPEVLKKSISFNAFPYSEDMVNRMERNLASLGITIKERKIIKKKGIYNILFEIKEKKGNEISAAASYTPPLGIEGFFYTDINNLFGYQERKRLGWENYGKGRLKFTAEISWPWIFLLPLEVSASSKFFAFDTTSNIIKLEASLSYMFAHNFKTGVGSGIENISAGEKNIKKKFLKTSITYKNSSFELRYGERKEKEKSSFLEIKGGSRINFKNIEFSPNGIWMYSPSPLDSLELFPIGGVNTLRGFKENKWWTKRAYWQRTTFYITKNMFLFSDFGVIKTNQIQYPLSYGLGGVISTALGIVELSFGLPLGAKLRDTKFHIKFLNRF